MQAFVLGAGLGLRLRPLTEHLPKPLVPIYQKPLITFSFDHLIAAGCETFVVNTHPHPERFSEFFPTTTYRNRPIRLLHEPELLGTGGGITVRSDVEEEYAESRWKAARLLAALAAGPEGPPPA